MCTVVPGHDPLGWPASGLCKLEGLWLEVAYPGVHDATVGCGLLYQAFSGAVVVVFDRVGVASASRPCKLGTFAWDVDAASFFGGGLPLPAAVVVAACDGACCCVGYSADKFINRLAQGGAVL